MADRILKLRELNRATLARQMLLKREPLPVLAAVERLVGLQAQLPVAPYVGLWTRLPDFRREDLARAIEDRKIVKATLMRATLHLCTADDYLRFRTTLQPMLSGAGDAIVKQRGGKFDSKKLLAEARWYIGEKPRTFAEISDWAAKLMPGQDVGALRYTVRTNLPLVQTPIATGWSYSAKPEFTLAESWFGRPIAGEDNLPELVFRYLALLAPLQ
jgi:DNA glycosylase AlkZ-like